MTIKQRADDAAVEHSRKSLVIFFRMPLGDDIAILGKAANMKALFVCRPAAKANSVWRVFFLKRNSLVIR